MLSKFSARQVFSLLFALLLSLPSQSVATTDTPTDFAGYDHTTKEISEMTIKLKVCTQSNCKSAKHELFASNGCYK